MNINVFYNQGTHLIIDETIHILFDPSYTENYEIPRLSYEEYIRQRDKNSFNEDYRDVDLILISHAHADHSDRLRSRQLIESNAKIIMHPFTYDVLFKHVDEYSTERFILLKEYEFTIPIQGIKVKALPSMHCGGSLMFLIEIEDSKILFTGDFNLEHSFSLPLLITNNIPNVDVLIMEASFGNPSLTSNKAKACSLLQSIIKDSFDKGENVMIFGQPLGKIQDIYMFLKMTLGDDAKYIMEDYPFYITRMYIEHYDNSHVHTIKKISDIFTLPRNSIIFAGITDLNVEHIETIREMFGITKIKPIIISGWTSDSDSVPEEIKKTIEDIMSKYKNTELITISSHADYNSLISFIRMTKPKYTFIFHGFSGEFSDRVSESIGVIAFDTHKRTRWSQSVII